jgi:carbon-monoxide dehydrogenase large subunit
VTIELEIPRVVVSPIEPRAAVGFHDAARDQLTLFANTQGVHVVRNVLARALGRGPETLRVVTPNVGGAFGSKIYAYPEHALVLHAARLLGRPVRWTSTRREALLTDTQGRGARHQGFARPRCRRSLPRIVGRAHRRSRRVPVPAHPLTATGVGAPIQGGAYRFQAIAITVRACSPTRFPSTPSAAPAAPRPPTSRSA